MAADPAAPDNGTGAGFDLDFGGTNGDDAEAEAAPQENSSEPSSGDPAVALNAQPASAAQTDVPPSLIHELAGAAAEHVHLAPFITLCKTDYRP